MARSGMGWDHWCHPRGSRDIPEVVAGTELAPKGGNSDF